MTTEYILNHTGREIMNTFSADEIESELKGRCPDGFDVANCFSDSPSGLLDSKPDIADAYRMLHDWYGDLLDWPVSASELAILITLYVAWQEAA